ncbi:MAG: DUF4852 domain-containing protein [Alphaproteobacteria bacterium]|nr:DUF4852 domain-containing protein [Alphaproteobacteria bacterium]
MKMACCFRIGLMLAGVFVFLAGTQSHADEYVKPNSERILESLVRFGALDLSNDQILDAFAQIKACDIYQEFYKDEFKWQKIRPVIREQVKKDIGTYPTAYRYETMLKLGRYDFEKKLYPFDESAQRFNINVFPINRDALNTCRFVSIHNAAGILPTSFKFVLDSLINIVSLPLDAEEGKAVVRRMDEDGNTDHFVYARFNIRVVFIAPVDFTVDEGKGKKTLSVRSQVTQSARSGAIVLDSRLDSIEYYEDENFTRMIYKYRP